MMIQCHGQEDDTSGNVMTHVEKVRNKIAQEVYQTNSSKTNYVQKQGRKRKMQNNVINLFGI